MLEPAEITQLEGRLPEHRQHARPSRPARQPFVTEASAAPMLQGCLLELINATPGLVMVSSSHGGLVYMNDTGRRMLGIDAQEDIYARKVHDLYSPSSCKQLREEAIPTCLDEGTWRGELTLLDDQQEEVPVSQVLMAHQVRGPNGRGPNGREATLVSSIAWDIREMKQVEQELRHRATHDALTGLPNRAMLMEQLRQAIATAGQAQNHVGVLFLDLDGFKQLNDQRGHETASQLLRSLAQRLKARVRTQDVVARYGGDEFVLLIPDLAAPGDVARVLQQVSEVLWEPFVVGGESLWLTASTGLALYPFDGLDADTLLRHADREMYEQKRKLKARA
jgi:diguanylate cyclase (GGDEF)-like protein